MVSNPVHSGALINHTVALGLQLPLFRKVLAETEAAGLSLKQTELLFHDDSLRVQEPKYEVYIPNHNYNSYNTEAIDKRVHFLCVLDP